ncbi:MAG: gspD 1 [Pedosphaera sp.]|nr:gspD 1 [Pedosphaera sp.]
MKPMNKWVRMIVLTGGLFVSTLGMAAEEPAVNSSEKTAEPTVGIDVQGANNVKSLPVEKGLRFNFRGVPLAVVLDYMSTAAGFVVQLNPGVEVPGNISAWSDQPLNETEAVALLKEVLNQHGHTAIQEGRTLTIFKREDAHKNDLPVKLGNNPSDIPRNADMVTQIIPVRTLNPTQLLKDLAPLLASETTLNANESAKSLLMTDTQTNIRRISEIVKALDAASYSVNSIRVFPLRYADARTLASLVKDLFPSQNATATNSNNGNNASQFPALPGGFPGIVPVGDPGNGGTGNNGDNAGNTGDSGGGQTPVARIAAMGDDRSNSLIVSVPQGVMPGIEQLVQSIDHDVEEVREMRVIKLKNADASEMADLLSNLFPGNDNPADASRSIQFGGFPGGPFGGGIQNVPNKSSSGQSGHLKKVNRVLSVADKRTQSLVVTAGKSMMPQLETMIKQLDANPAHKKRVHFYPLANARPEDVQQILQDLFPFGNNSGNSSSTLNQNNDPLATRDQTMQQQEQQQVNGMGFGNGSRSGGVGGRSSGIGP